MPDREPRLHYLILPLAALIVLIPLFRYGCSCGHDFDFHILNWFEAARQFTHGTLHPHWAYTPAWNAGEPRFIFYPPISWTIGALLGLIMPWTWTPIAYTWLALTAAGFALYHLACSFTSPNAALLAATFYVVNPYMLFTAYERTAYAELLAAAWIPLLLHAILREQVTIPRIAIPVALLWLTNAPAAVMSCYTLALLTLIRIATNPRAPSFASFAKGGVSRESATPAHLSATKPLTSIQLALRTTAGTLLGLALAAFYILPAAYERRYVQIAMAVVSGLHPQDNFLFLHTSDPAHDTVLHTASTVAIILIALTAITLAVNLLNRHKAKNSTKQTIIPLTILTLTIALLLTPLSALIWHYLPELRFLQFPWRLLAILAPTLSLAIALALSRFKLKPPPTAALALAIAASLTWPAYHAFHQRCYPEDTIPARLTVFHSANPGTDPTDEYTPATASNEALANANPPFWLSADDPDAPAPSQSTPSPAPPHLTLNSPDPQTLILNLRDYPTWHLTNNGAPIPTRIEREDGLIAIPLPAGPSDITITYAQTTDQTIGYFITAIALLTLLLTYRLTLIQSKRPHPHRSKLTSHR